MNKLEKLYDIMGQDVACSHTLHESYLDQIKELMYEAWMRSAYKSKVKGEHIDKDYERSCFERWLTHT